MSVNLIPARRYDAPRWQKKGNGGFFYTSPEGGGGEASRLTQEE